MSGSDSSLVVVELVDSVRARRVREYFCSIHFVATSKKRPSVELNFDQSALVRTGLTRYE